MVCGGMRWFACISLIGFTAYRPKFWWWFAVICGGLWWFAVVCGGLRSLSVSVQGPVTVSLSH